MQLVTKDVLEPEADGERRNAPGDERGDRDRRAPPGAALGRSERPEVGDGLYTITLGPYAFYWLSLEDRRTSAEA